MRDLDGVIREVDLVMGRLIRCRQDLAELIRSASGIPLEDDLQDDLREEMDRYRGRLATLLQQTVDFPPRHRRHFELLPEFWADGSYEKSVFLMAKFPDGRDAAKDRELERVLDVAAAAVEGAGFTPRLARGPKRYHGGLWDNVELHLLGCSLGIAIVEDRHTDELNPNISMEWGWMRGMGKPVLFLVEDGFRQDRADLNGLIRDGFEWNDPETTITPAIHAWLSAIATQ
jgi:hypothetical protein